MEKAHPEKAILQPDLFSADYQGKAGMFLCTSGSADILINGQVYHVSPGTLHLVSPLLTLYPVSQSPDYDGIRIIDNLEVFYPIIRSNVEALLQLRIRNSPCLRLDEQSADYIARQRRLIDTKLRLVEMAASPEEKALTQQIVQHLEQETLLEIMSLYFRLKPVDSEPVEKNEAVVYNFIYSLHTHFKQERSVSYYAGEARLSVGYFTSLIKQKTDSTPSEWIVTITIAHAKLQLAKTQKSIKEIAEDLHFPEQFTFRKYFKQYVGIPPKEYRMQAKKEADGGCGS